MILGGFHTKFYDSGNEKKKSSSKLTNLKNSNVENYNINPHKNKLSMSLHDTLKSF